MSMGLFDEAKNSYYTCMQNIINRIINYGEDFDQEAILDLFDEHAFNMKNLYDDPMTTKNYSGRIKDKFISELLGDNTDIKTVSLLNEQDNIYDPSIGETIPYMLTSNELRYLKTLLNDVGVQGLLGDELTEKLYDKLEAVQEFNWDKYCITIGERFKENDLEKPEVINHISIIINAIRQERELNYTYAVNNETILENQCGIPYRMIYSPKLGKLQLIMIVEDKDWPILMNLNKFTEIKMGKKSLDRQDCAVELIKGKKHIEEPLILEVKKIYGSIERCFTVFSNHQKRAYYNDDIERHILEVRYYDFEKQDIIRTILSLGDAVVVKSPLSIRDEVIRRLKRAYFV